MIEVSGWASEPFVMTEVSARKSLERVRSRRSQYSPEDYERHLSVYVEAFKLMEWEIPADPNAPIPEAVQTPVEPVAAKKEQLEGEKPSILPSAEPVAAPEPVSDPLAVPLEPPIPGPVKRDGPIQGPEKTWVEKMVEGS